MNKSQEKLFNLIVPFIPESIVMNAIAYSNPQSLQNTINNVYDKVIKSFIDSNPRKMNENFEEIKDFIQERILVRILVK